jgi:DNA-3-methyladenine glycosylase II
MRSKTKQSPTPSNRDIAAIRLKLSKRDAILAVAHRAAAPFEWRVRDAGFAGLVRLIIEQQISTASAAAIWNRFQSGVGRITSERVTTFNAEGLRGFGLSRQKAQYVQAIAEAECSGRFDFRQLQHMDDEVAIEYLTTLKGVGRWTSEIYLMFCEGRTDLFPAGDLALQEGYRLASGAKERLSQKELHGLADRWRPNRGIAALLLWSYYRHVRSSAAPALAV